MLDEPVFVFYCQIAAYLRETIHVNRKEKENKIRSEHNSSLLTSENKFENIKILVIKSITGLTNKTTLLKNMFFFYKFINI